MPQGQPSKIRELQKKLYEKAKQEPNYRFYLLYGRSALSCSGLSERQV